MLTLYLTVLNLDIANGENLRGSFRGASRMFSYMLSTQSAVISRQRPPTNDDTPRAMLYTDRCTLSAHSIPPPLLLVYMYIHTAKPFVTSETHRVQILLRGWKVLKSNTSTPLYHNASVQQLNK